MRYALTDDEWTAIKPMLPNKPRGVPRVNDRRVLNGIFWVLRSGAPWRDLPVIFPAYRAWEFYAFAQDKWVITPKLTLDYGLRWEFYPPAKPAHSGGFSNYDPATSRRLDQDHGRAGRRS